MTLPSTKPLNGNFWYVLDGQGELSWKPCSSLRGEFYLSWLGQGKSVVGAGLARMNQGQITSISTHGTPYYWLQPYEALPPVHKSLVSMRVRGCDSVNLDYSLAGWGMRDTSRPPVQPRPPAKPTLTDWSAQYEKVVGIIVQGFHPEKEMAGNSVASQGLLNRVAQPKSAGDLPALLENLDKALGPQNVTPMLIHLIEHDLNVTPGYRRESFFEIAQLGENFPPGKSSRLVISAIYHLGPYLCDQYLNNALLLNCLRQRHPFDVAWGASYLIKCFGMINLVRLLQVAITKETDGQVRGNGLDLLQELGYGFSVGLGGQIFAGLAELLEGEALSSFGQVLTTHMNFIQMFIQQSQQAGAA